MYGILRADLAGSWIALAAFLRARDFHSKMQLALPPSPVAYSSIQSLIAARS